MSKIKIFELTTNGEDGYAKWYVRGLKDENEARSLAKRGFGKYYWDTDGAISYYDDYSSKWKNRALTKSQFLKHTDIYRKKQY